MCGSMATVLSLTACYDDESTLATKNIPEVSITSDDETTLYVGYLDQLDITPTVNRGTEADTVGLTYKWEITEEAKTSSEMIELATTRDLHAVISNNIETTPYYLTYTVTDTQNGGLQYTKQWEVVVQSSFLDGIAVSDTRDGATSDLNLIMSKDLTLNYGQKADKVFYSMLENANGKPFDQLMTQLTYKPLGQVQAATANYVWVVTSEGDVARFDTKDYSLSARLSEGGIMTYKPEGIKAYNTFSAGSYLFLNTDKYIYSINTTAANNFGWYDAAASNYTIENAVVMNTTSSNVSYQFLMFYDATLGAFVYRSSDYASPVWGADIAANDFFDPTNMTGYTAIAAGQTTDAATPAFVMKNKATGEYGIYTFSRYEDAEGTYDDDWNWIETAPAKPTSAKMYYAIPAEGKALLDQAVSVFFAVSQSILYVATPSGIYAINFAGSSAIVNTTAVYTPDAGETIAKAKLYLQGAYMADYQWVGGQDDPIAELDLNRKAVIVATQSDTYEGKISVVPMTQIGTGRLDKSTAKTYTGFGKILDFCTTGY